jgi:hypothetical protein
MWTELSWSTLRYYPGIEENAEKSQGGRTDVWKTLLEQEIADITFSLYLTKDPRHDDVWRSGGIAPLILNLGT